jgi:hypothetical protein
MESNQCLTKTTKDKKTTGGDETNVGLNFNFSIPVTAVLVLNTPDDERLRPKHVE